MLRRYVYGWWSAQSAEFVLIALQNPALSKDEIGEILISTNGCE
jgi:hypothetical protein